MRVWLLVAGALAGCATGPASAEEREVVERYLAATRFYAEATGRGSQAYTSIVSVDERSFFFFIDDGREEGSFHVQANGERMKVTRGGRVDEGAATPLFYRAMRAMALALPHGELRGVFLEGIPDQGSCTAIERACAVAKAVARGGGCWWIETGGATVTLRVDAVAKVVIERTLQRVDDHSPFEIRERFDRLILGTSRKD